MIRLSSTKKAAFTLLEVCLAIMIAMLILGVAVPTMTGVMGRSKTKELFRAFDDMAQEARSRSMKEKRNYVLVWGAGRDKKVVLRPEEPANKSEAEGVRQWEISKDESLDLQLPAALTPKGSKPDAIWTFWSNGVCEPAEVRYEGKAGKWSAIYNPFTAQAEVKYD